MILLRSFLFLFSLVLLRPYSLIALLTFPLPVMLRFA